MPELSIDELTVALAVVGGVALLGFLLAIFLAVRLSRLRHNYLLLRGTSPPTDIFGVVGRALKHVEAIDTRVDEVHARQERHIETTRLSLQRFGIVRYDAFEDMGGRLSFSAALLDDHGDGIVITSINGRTETRTYAKPIRQMKSEHNLSDEENAAIAAAVAGHGRTAPAVAAAR